MLNRQHIKPVFNDIILFPYKNKMSIKKCVCDNCHIQKDNYFLCYETGLCTIDICKQCLLLNKRKFKSFI